MNAERRTNYCLLTVLIKLLREQGNRGEKQEEIKNTNSLSKRSLIRSHPVSGNSGLPMLLGIVLGEGMGAEAGLVVEEEEEGIRSGWAAATSAAWTLGSRKQKEGGLALWMRPCSRPVLSVPRGAKSARRLCRVKPVLGCSGFITLQLALGCSRGRNTWPWVGMLHPLPHLQLHPQNKQP